MRLGDARENRKGQLRHNNGAGTIRASSEEEFGIYFLECGSPMLLIYYKVSQDV